MDKQLEERLLIKSKDLSVDITSREFALALDTADPLRQMRSLFHYPTMKDLPHGNVNTDPTCSFNTMMLRW